MLNERYSIAASETLHYLKGIRQADIEKIPKKFMDFLNENASKDYVCEFDYKKPLKELNLKRETKGIIATICINYWCETDEQKSNFKNLLYENEVRYQNELREKCNDIFKTKEKNIKLEEIEQYNNNLPAVIEESFIKRILKNILNFFKK